MVTREVQWFWRRLFTFLFVGINTATIGWIVLKLDDPDALKWIGLGLITADILLAFVYMAGATSARIALASSRMTLVVGRSSE